ncbi:sugar ABC transporter substrate-binding protein [Defluviitalea phaphyphila]|uniref:sugar ABC transporter substrate-binding protein n=1 Tax=Defluviitalea phaphyphila TaxID=1473580 RepID=UPI0007317169|nr:substrate-binding domain-containing protein [Defluviitalea phaphyphila]
MKNKYYTFFLFLIILILIIIGFIFYRINNTINKGEQNIGMIVPENIPSYHFAIIYKDMEDSNWFFIKKGVERASKDFNVAVEFNGSYTYDEQELERYMDIAIASKVDGIVTYVWNVDKTGELINKAVEKEIPVITIGTDAEKSNRASFVGGNTYDIGAQLGELAFLSTEGKGEVVILNGNKKGSEAILQNLMILGIHDVLEQYSDININIIEYDGLSLFEIEDAITSLLDQDLKISTIICTSTKDTVILAERLIDLNKVDYNIIGYGISADLLGYIERGVVFGTVTPDLEQMGYDTIKALVDLKEKGRTSAYFNVDTFVITQENISKYLNIGEE